MKQYAVSDMAQLVQGIVTIVRNFGDAKPWWRGHSVIDWSLTPSLYRRGLSENELNINSRFRMMARSRHTNCPHTSEPFPWLFLMQHYRLPTRLLDWTESPLIALFFALEKDVNDVSDAAIWALLPTGLNLHQMGEAKICSYGSRSLGNLAFEAFNRNTTNPDSRILSVLTEQSDPRQMVQQSAFTIHGSNTPIVDLPEADSYLSRILIPKKAKKSFRQILGLLGVSRATLFPDLENLAIELSSLDFAQLETPNKQ